MQKSILSYFSKVPEKKKETDDNRNDKAGTSSDKENSRIRLGPSSEVIKFLCNTFPNKIHQRKMYSQ